jgi:hypothetical protein
MPESDYGIGDSLLDNLEIGPDPYSPISSPLFDGYTNSKTCPFSASSSKSHDPIMLLDSVVIDESSISVPIFSGDSSAMLTRRRTTITSRDNREKNRDKTREREKKGGSGRLTKADIVNTTAVSAKNSLKAKVRIIGGHGHGSTGGKHGSKRREKAYHCPVSFTFFLFFPFISHHRSN